MATNQKNQSDRSDRSSQSSPDNKDRETQTNNSQDQGVFNNNQKGLPQKTFNGNDDETRQIDGKKPKMAIDKDDDDLDIEEGDERVTEVDYENIDEQNTDPEKTDDEEQDGSDPIPGKD